MRKSSGYILILTLLLLSTSFILISSILQKTFAYLSQSQIEIDREHARQMALSGIQLVLSKISLVIPEKKENKDEVKKDMPNSEHPEKTDDKKETPEQKWLISILPILNSWQNVTLNYDSAGIDATISYFLSSQQGKFNLIAIDKDLSELVKKAIKVDIISTLEECKKQLGRPIQDPTEMIKASSFTPLKNKLFTVPSVNKENIDISATDLFYIEDGNDLKLLNPWLLSSSTSKALGMVPKFTPAIIKDIVSKFKPDMNWQSEWDNTLAKIYNKKFATIDPKIKKILSSKFIADSFFVVCYATVNSVTQKAAALLKLDKTVQGFAPESKIYKIAQLYWI